MDASRTRGLLRRQLPTGQPPSSIEPPGPKLRPDKERVAQVFSTYDALPVAARFWSETVEVTADPPPWVFSVAVPDGWVLVLRSIRAHLNVTSESSGPFITHLYAPGAGRLSVQRGGGSLPDSDVMPFTIGQSVPVYLVAGEGETVGALVDVVDFDNDDTVMRVTFTGELLRPRGLMADLEVGHEAAIVRVARDAKPTGVAP